MLQNGGQNYVKGEKAWLPKHFLDDGARTLIFLQISNENWTGNSNVKGGQKESGKKERKNQQKLANCLLGSVGLEPIMY